MKNLDSFVNLYPVSKTLCFELIPQGETAKKIEESRLLVADLERSKAYKEVKKIIDNYHKDFIERSLADPIFEEEELERFANLYYDRKGNNEEKYKKEKSKLCKRISDHFKGQKEFNSLFEKEMVEKILPEYVKTEKEKEQLNNFHRFTCYFTKFNANRENMYASEEQATAIGNRIVNDNLPKFFDNVKSAKTVFQALPKETVDELENTFQKLYHVSLDQVFSLSYAGKVFSQTQIDIYNGIIGGYTTETGEKIQGINEKINLYNQTHDERLPKMKMLYKQILSDRETASFVPHAFTEDDELLEAVYTYWEKTSEYFSKIAECLSSPDAGLALIDKKYVSQLSQALFNEWSIFSDSIDHNQNFITVSQFQKMADLHGKKTDALLYISTEAATMQQEIREAYAQFCALFTLPYTNEKKLAKNDDGIVVLKRLMDAWKTFQSFAAHFYLGKDEEIANPLFYGEFTNYYEQIIPITTLYNEVRNYVAKKPYSLEKYKIFFNCSHFLSGWAKPNEYQPGEAHLLSKDGSYYLFVTAKGITKTDIETLYKFDEDNSATLYQYYFQKVNGMNIPRLFIRTKKDKLSPNIEKYNLPINDILKIYDEKKYCTKNAKEDPKEFKEALSKMIDYFKLGFKTDENFKDFCFDWRPSDEYSDIMEFYDDIAPNCYKIEETHANFEAFLSLVSQGKGFLFKIYNKDFSENSTGIPNLHTVYFKMLFDKLNLSEKRIKLSGEAEIFYRPQSMKYAETTIHKANEPLVNKNSLNEKKTSTFSYDLVKDKRFTKPHFELHLSIIMNFRSQRKSDRELNQDVLSSIREDENQHIIGIDRGERNLLYISVIDNQGHIVEQKSLNLMESDYQHGKCRTDYKALLDKKESERLDARKNWKTVVNIKNLKEGYLSQAVFYICQLVKRYNAIIVMENLTSGFKNSRSSVEASVYQKFETMLCNKLSYLASKKASPDEVGSILHAYQLAWPKTSYNDLFGQNGIIFYVSAWLTSKIDPTTGFVDSLHPRYKNIDEAKEFFKKMDAISYNPQTDMFEFDVDYQNFPVEASYRKKWTICTNGERIITYRNNKKNNTWENKTICLTAEMKRLFDANRINIMKDLKTQICEQNSAEFFKELTLLFAYTLQMRNSETGNTDVDYILSPVRNKDGYFFDSREATTDLPIDADANGAYNIARKGLWTVRQIQKQEQNLFIGKTEWLEFAQNQ